MRASQLLAPAQTRDEQHVNGDQNRTVMIRLHKDAPQDRIALSWHEGRGARPSRFILEKGHTTTQPIRKARAWFGWFTIPFDMIGEQDERKRNELSEFFTIERARTLLAWGGYPLPRKMVDGTDPIGPIRFPDVEVKVLEADGSVMMVETDEGKKTEWIRLHNLYEVGEWDAMQFTAPVDPEAARIEFEKREHDLQRQIDELRGSLNATTAVLALVPKDVLANLKVSKAS